MNQSMLSKFAFFVQDLPPFFTGLPIKNFAESIYSVFDYQKKKKWKTKTLQMQKEKLSGKIREFN